MKSRSLIAAATALIALSGPAFGKTPSVHTGVAIKGAMQPGTMKGGTIEPEITPGFSVNYSLRPSAHPEMGLAAQSTGRINEDYLSMSFQPGVVLSKETLLYGIISYNWVGSQSQSSRQRGLGNQAMSLFGIGYGVGARYQIDREIFLQFEATTVDYERGRSSTARTNNGETLGSFGLGYRF